METLAISATIVAPSSSSLRIFSPKTTSLFRRFYRFQIYSKDSDKQSSFRYDSEDSNSLPLISDCNFLSSLSKDAAMSLSLSAASVRGWTTDSGMEGPPVPAGSETEIGTGMRNISTFPWSLFTKSPRRRMRVAFTCNVCGQRTTRAINPHAYTDGTVFVQCCGCNVFHKLVDNLNLFHDMKCYVTPNFNYSGPDGNAGFKFMEDDDNNILPSI